MKNLLIHILFICIVAFIFSGCLTATRSPFVKDGRSRSLRFEGPYINQSDTEGWGLLRGVSITYEWQYGWAPQKRKGFGHEIGAKFGYDIWQHHDDAACKDSRISEIGIFYYLSHTFKDSSLAVKFGLEFPGVYRIITGIRRGKNVLYFHGSILPPACHSCDEDKHNLFVGLGIDHPILKWNSSQLNFLFETCYPINFLWDGGPLHVWRADKLDDNWSEKTRLSFPIIGIGFRLSK